MNTKYILTIELKWNKCEEQNDKLNGNVICPKNVKLIQLTKKNGEKNEDKNGKRRLERKCEECLICNSYKSKDITDS